MPKSSESKIRESARALQEEEHGVLLAIYNDDPAYTKNSNTTVQYKFDIGPKTFVMAITWVPKYPYDQPIMNLDLQGNEHLLESEKLYILETLHLASSPWRGYPMTYSIIESVKDLVQTIIKKREDESKNSEDLASDDNEQEKEEATCSNAFGELWSHNDDSKVLKIGEPEEEAAKATKSDGAVASASNAANTPSARKKKHVQVERMIRPKGKMSKSQKCRVYEEPGKYRRSHDKEEEPEIPKPVTPPPPTTGKNKSKNTPHRK